MQLLGIKYSKYYKSNIYKQKYCQEVAIRIWIKNSLKKLFEEKN